MCEFVERRELKSAQSRDFVVLLAKEKLFNSSNKPVISAPMETTNQAIRNFSSQATRGRTKCLDC